MGLLHPAVRELLGEAPEIGEDLEELTVSLLQSLIRNACVNCGDGSCEEVTNIRTLAAFFDKYGIKYQVYHPPHRPNRPSLIAEYHGGTGIGPRVMLGPGHVDVVPVNEKAWDVPPFEARLVGGEVWGRGSLDMLNTVAAQAVAFACLATSRLPMRGTLIFCAVSDEEAGGADGAGFLMNEPKLRDIFRADYCMTEFGGATLPDRYNRPSRTYYHVSGEKGTATINVVCKGRPGHGSLPKSCDNALVKAAEVVRCLANYWSPTIITPEWRNIMAASDAPWIVRTCLTSAWFAPAIIRLLLLLGHPLGSAAHASTRLTLSPNHLTGTHKSNVVPGTAVVEVDGRLMPGQDKAYLIRQLERALGRRRMASGDYEIRIRHFFPATTSPVDTPLWKAMEKAGRMLVDGTTFVNGLLTGATDSRFFRHHCGAIAYGTSLFQPELTLDKLMKSIHGDNERISVASLGISVQYFVLTILYMLGAAEEAS